MLILTQYIAKHELKPLTGFLDLDDIIGGAKKVLRGLAVETGSPGGTRGSRFFKIRIGKRKGARMIVFMTTESKKITPILIRLKKDKIFGENMAMNNPAVVKQIKKNLDRIMEDIGNKEYEEFAL